MSAGVLAAPPRCGAPAEMRVLLLEDDAGLAASLCAGLSANGIHATPVGTGQLCLDRLSTSSYDALILDVRLGPGMDGFEVCRRLRRARVTTPVLMLTALDGVADRVVGLDLGADDYLVKPFALDEVAARLRALSRRHATHKGSVLEVGNVVLDTGTRGAAVAGRGLVLTDKEVALLELLLRREGVLLTQEEILAAVWPSVAEPLSNLVEVYVGRLRRKLAAADAGVSIRTFKRMGYRLDPVRTAPQGAPAVAAWEADAAARGPSPTFAPA